MTSFYKSIQDNVEYNHIKKALDEMEHIATSGKLVNPSLVVPVSFGKLSLQAAVEEYLSGKSPLKADIIIEKCSEYYKDCLTAIENKTKSSEEAHKDRIRIDRIFSIVDGEVHKLLDPDLTSTASFKIPDEVPAPLRVGVRNDLIVALHPQNHTGQLDYEAVNRVREELRDHLADLINDYSQGSNADRRYLAACSRLLQHLSQPMEQISIEALGLNYQLVERLTKRLGDETSGIIIDVMENTLSGISVLLNQFQQWRDYLQELAKTNLQAHDSATIVAHGQKLIIELSQPGVPVHRSVIERLKDMVEPAVTGIIDADTVAIPLICSYSNLFSLLANLALEQLPAANAPLATAGATVILVSFAAEMIKQFCPILSQFQPLKFILDVSALITKFYSQGKDMLTPKD